MNDNTEALPPLPDYIERVLLDYADACFRCGEYPGDDASRYRALSDHRERMWQSVVQAIRAALAQRQQVPADALLRLWPAIEKAMSGLVFTAKRAGEVQADMNAVRAALTAAPSAQEEPCQWCCGTGRFADHACRFCAGKAKGSVFAAPSAQAEQALEGLSATTRELGGYDAQAEPTLCHRNPAPNASQPMVPTPSLAVTIGAAQAEPQVPLPFTFGQRRRLWNNSPEIHADAKSFAAFERIVQLVEAAHGIGKQEST